MRGRLECVIVALALAMACHADAWAQPIEPPLIEVAPTDAAMNAAIKEARRTLPIFRRIFDRRPRDVEAYWIKIAMPTYGGGHEYIWVYDLSWGAGTVTGKLANEPEHLPGLHLDSKVTVKQETIADWAYLKRGKLYGHFTTRVLAARMSEREAAEARAAFAPQPLEPGLP